jgi:hypothetical protein
MIAAYDIEHRIEIPAPLVLVAGIAVIGILIWVAILIWLLHFNDLFYVDSRHGQSSIQRAEDNRHLRIKKDLTELEERQVEWLHVGLMNCLYGNLLEKRDHDYRMELGDGWYFERD